MLPSSFKAKVQRVLIKEGFKKSDKTKGRVIDNVSAGFTFSKLWDDYYLYFTSGNMASRGMSLEEKDKKTMEIFERLISLGYENYIELTKKGEQAAIMLVSEKIYKEREVK